MLGTQATPERVAALRAEMGLDRPLLVRYGEWLAGFFTGNLGISVQLPPAGGTDRPQRWG